MSSPSDTCGADTLALLKRIQDAVGRVGSKTQEVRSDDSVTMSLFMRAWRLFDAIIILLERNLPEEAVILSRALFTDALRLAEMQAAGPDRAALSLAYVNESIDEKQSLVNEAVRVGLDI